MNKLTSLIIPALLLSACSKTTQRLPQSSSRPYEVIVVNDSSNHMKDVLAADCDSMPQPEPLFDVTSISSKNMHGTIKLARAIVICDNRKTTLVERNKDAEPQIVIHGSVSDSTHIRALLGAFEYQSAVNELKRRHNPKMEKTIKAMFGISMLIPTDMNSSKKARNFIWISNNTVEGMKNIVILKGNVEEMLRNNLKGETDSMYLSLKDHGLWEMKGDAMGGPYRMKTWKNGKETITVIAFTYSPGTRKRNYMRQLEAVLYTIN